MENVTKLLDAVKAKAEITSDYALAKTLEIPSARVCDYYKGRRTPDNDLCLKIAKALDKPLAEVIAQVGIDSAKDEIQKKAWKDYFKSLGGRAAGFMIFAFAALLVVNLILTQPAQASQIQGLQSTQDAGIQIMRAWRREILAALDMLKSAILRFYCWYWPETGKAV